MQTLAGAGVEVVSVDSGRLVLSDGAGGHPFTLHRRSRPPRVSEIAAPTTANALLVVPRLTSSAQAKLRHLGWSWATDAGQLHLRFPGRLVDLPGAETAQTGRRTQVAPLAGRGTGVFAVLRRMMLIPRLRQVQLASMTGLTQPRVSQILATLSEPGIVTRTPRGWEVVDWDEALRVWLSSYPGAGGVTTYWLGLDDAWASTTIALSALRDDAVVSGDVAADLLAPWRQPQTATVYVRAMDSLARTGLVQVPSAADGAVAVCVPEDITVWPFEPLTREFRDQAISLADPIQVLSDLVRAQDDDSAQAAAHLTRWIKARYVEGRDG
jgi:hypothetical protein